MEPQNPPSVRVAELLGEELSDLHLRVLAGESHLDNPITHPRVQKPGLAFAGYYAYIKPGRVQIIGESGVGKSESALDLVTRGHSLVADDRVTVKRYPNSELVGFSEGALRHHMELRGIGIINVQDLFGLAAVRERANIDLVIELEHWQTGRQYDRLGLDETLFNILDTPCPYIRMPVALGRNISILVEIAARNHVLKSRGHHSAREFARQLEAELERNRKVPRKETP